MDNTQLGGCTLDALKVRSRMDAQQLFEGRRRRVVVNEIGIDSLGNQVIVDGSQTLRAFRMMRTHIMQLAVAMGDEGSGCHLFSLCEPALEAAHVEMPLSSHSSGSFKH